MSLHSDTLTQFRSNQPLLWFQQIPSLLSLVWLDQVQTHDLPHSTRASYTLHHQWGSQWTLIKYIIVLPCLQEGILLLMWSYKWDKGRGLWCLNPRSSIFQLYHGGQFYWWSTRRKQTTDLSLVTDTLYYVMLYRVHRTHNVSVDKHWFHG